MVLDALGAFALACNVLQAIEYGSKLLSTAIAYGKAESGLLVEHHALETIAKDLLSITKSLQDGSEPPKASESDEPLHFQLQKACKQCVLLSTEFIVFLDRYKLKGNPALWKRLGAAMRVAWKKEHMAAMQSSLARAQSNLHLAFLISSHSRLESMISNSTTQLEQSMATAVKTELEKNKNRSSQISELLEPLTRLDIEDKAFVKAAARLSSDYEKDLARLSRACANVSSNANASRSNAYSNEVLLIRRQVLASLHFAEIYNRYDHITEAHVSTFDWALSGTSASSSKETTLVSWLTSDVETEPVYWVSGKPGSGKSTLLRYIGENLFDIIKTRKVFADRLLIMVRTFFWKPGRPVQHSLEGFLRTLLFQLLEKYPNLLDQAVPTDMWEDFESMLETTGKISSQEQSLHSWTNRKMQETVHRLLALLTQSSYIVLLIDGLDELGKTDGDRMELLNYLDTLKQYKFIKIICSSRPWIIFKDWFSQAPQLKLEDLTKNDIQYYVKDKLADNVHFQRSCLGNMELSESLIDDILKKARGVFLWVYLVVRELVTGAQHGETIRSLRRRFDAIPPDLNEYFKRIMQNIEPRYAKEAAALFQIQLAYSTTSDQTGIISLQPRLLELSFLDLDRLDFAWDEDFVPDFALSNSVDRAAMLELMERRIGSRCMGLLEVQNGHLLGYNHDDYWGLYFGQITEFFHRSFCDFLEDEVESVLYEHTDGKFDVVLYRLNAYLSLLTSLDSHILAELTHYRFPKDIGLLETILREIGSIVEQRTNLSEVFAGTIVNLLNKWSKSIRTDKSSQNDLLRLLHSWKSSFGSYMTELAVSYGWITWSEAHLTSMQVQCKQGKPYLHYCLSPALNYSHDWQKAQLLHPNWTTVISVILRKGADVNREFDDRTVITLMLITLSADRSGQKYQQRDAIVKIVKEMLTRGLSPYVPARHLVNRDSIAIPDLLSTQVKAIRFHRKAHFQILDRWPLAELASPSNFTREGVYTLKSLLASIDFSTSELEECQQLIDARQPSTTSYTVLEKIDSESNATTLPTTSSTDKKRMFDFQMDHDVVMQPKRKRRNSQ